MEKTFIIECRRLLYLITLFLFFVLFLSQPVFATQFGDLVNVSNDPDKIDTGPAIAVDKNNYVHIAWQGFFAQSEAPDGVAADIFYTNNVGGSFAPPVQINVPTGWYSRDPSIAVDSAGNAHIVFRRSEDQTSVLPTDDIYYVTNASGNFDNPALIVDGIFGILGPTEVSMPMSPLIQCDSQDNLHIIFTAFRLGDFIGSLLVY